MLGIILGVAGVAGGGIAALVAKFGMNVVLGEASGFLKSVPRWAWIALAVIALLVAGIIWHQRHLRAHDAALVKATIATRDQQWRDALAKAHSAAIAARTRHEAAAAKISTTLKGQHDAQVRSNASDARDLQLRGPGKAAANCGFGDHPGVPAAAGQPGRPAGGAGAAAGQVPAADGLAGLPAERFAIVPWSWLVEEVAQPADDSRTEVLTWRNWYAQQFTAWERMRAAAARSTPTKGTTDGR